MVGSIKPTRMLSIINTYVVAFFDRYLKGEPEPLLDGPRNGYPEVSITAKDPGQ